MDTKNQEYSVVPFQCIFNEFGFLLDISSKINLHVWFYYYMFGLVFLTILYITLETGHTESSVLLSLSASCLFICLGFYIAFNTVQVISRRVVGKARETSTYSWARFCTGLFFQNLVLTKVFHQTVVSPPIRWIYNDSIFVRFCGKGSTKTWSMSTLSLTKKRLLWPCCFCK